MQQLQNKLRNSERRQKKSGRRRKQNESNWKLILEQHSSRQQNQLRVSCNRILSKLMDGVKPINQWWLPSVVYLVRWWSFSTQSPTTTHNSTDQLDQAKVLPAKELPTVNQEALHLNQGSQLNLGINQREKSQQFQDWFSIQTWSKTLSTFTSMKSWNKRVVN